MGVLRLRRFIGVYVAWFIIAAVITLPFYRTALRSAPLGRRRWLINIYFLKGFAKTSILINTTAIVRGKELNENLIRVKWGLYKQV